METPHATLHLRVLGESHKVSVAIPPTPGRMEDLLPAARAITHVTTQVAIEKTTAAGAPPTCRRGCCACCYQLVAVTIPEARALSRLVAAMPAEKQVTIRQRFADTDAAARACGVVLPDSPPGLPVLTLNPSLQGIARALDLARRYFALHRPCGFLDNGECGIYENRPLICREYLVTTPPEVCEHLDIDAVQMVIPPVKLSEGFAAVTAFVEKKDTEQIPLFAALAWAQLPESRAPTPHVSGPDLLRILAHWVDAKSEKPFDGRTS